MFYISIAYFIPFFFFLLINWFILRNRKTVLVLWGYKFALLGFAFILSRLFLNLFILRRLSGLLND